MKKKKYLITNLNFCTNYVSNGVFNPCTVIVWEEQRKTKKTYQKERRFHFFVRASTRDSGLRTVIKFMLHSPDLDPVLAMQETVLNALIGVVRRKGTEAQVHAIFFFANDFARVIGIWHPSLVLYGIFFLVFCMLTTKLFLSAYDNKLWVSLFLDNVLRVVAAQVLSSKVSRRHRHVF